MDKIQIKKNQLKQKNHLIKVFSDYELFVNEVVYSPKSNEIADLFVCKTKEQDGDISKSVSRDFDSVCKNMGLFLKRWDGETTVICVLPNVSICDGKVETELPVLIVKLNLIEKIFRLFSINGNFDFFGVSLLDYSSGFIIDSYADYPSDENEYFDGSVYEVYSWSTGTAAR